MDVHCSTCSEPWDVYHLWHDAIFETGLSIEDAEAWRSLPRSQKLSERFRKEFRAVGWEFGRTVINVLERAVVGGQRTSLKFQWSVDHRNHSIGDSRAKMTL